MAFWGVNLSRKNQPDTWFLVRPFPSPSAGRGNVLKCFIFLEKKLHLQNPYKQPEPLQIPLAHRTYLQNCKLGLLNAIRDMNDGNLFEKIDFSLI